MVEGDADSALASCSLTFIHAPQDKPSFLPPINKLINVYFFFLRRKDTSIEALGGKVFAGQWFKQRGKSNYSIVQDKRLTVATVTFRKTSRGGGEWCWRLVQGDHFQLSSLKSDLCSKGGRLKQDPEIGIEDEENGLEQAMEVGHLGGGSEATDLARLM